MNQNKLADLSTDELMDMFVRVDDSRYPERAWAIYAELKERGALSAAALNARYGEGPLNWWSLLWRVPLGILLFPFGDRPQRGALEAKTKVARLAAITPKHD
ncbi:hypothetical protein [Bowmanella pacifica]|uniref:Uncharacterized protein n=1 Tax=Bowmanella pacifica TaxID=502051 RepID=A0A918DJB0_9ALTE|nr:hypothetical protein [Bowmanella pacifica]GGO69844.1 hypothetical protein GCM10010982_21950 [Bowmanella pacifica]